MRMDDVIMLLRLVVGFSKLFAYAKELKEALQTTTCLTMVFVSRNLHLLFLC